MRLLHKTLAARAAVLIVGVTILTAIVVLFSGAQRELAPQEDMGYVFVQTKAPQYANVDYTVRFSAEVERIFHQFTGYFVSARDYEEYQRLKAMMPVAAAAEELDDDMLRALSETKMDKRHAALNALMD